MLRLTEIRKTKKMTYQLLINPVYSIARESISRINGSQSWRLSNNRLAAPRSQREVFRDPLKI
jgi:hypothetical protein